MHNKSIKNIKILGLFFAFILELIQVNTDKKLKGREHLTVDTLSIKRKKMEYLQLTS